MSIKMNSYFYSKVSRPDKLAVHVFEVDEDADKDEVSLCATSCPNTCEVSLIILYLANAETLFRNVE